MNSFQNISFEKRKIILNLKNTRIKEKSTTNCIYGLTNGHYKNYIKIGSTNNPERRKYDYITSSPYKYEYLWIFYLKNFNYLLCDELLKFELKQFNIKFNDKNVGVEFYDISSPEIISNILKKYNIKFNLEIGDKFNKKIEIKQNNILDTKMDNIDPRMLKILSKYTPEEIQKLVNLAGIEEVNDNPEIDLLNYKYRHIKPYIDSLTLSDLGEIKCQSKHFFIERIKKNIKDICILGLIQSGKTNEILNLVLFCIKFLKIPVIIVIQNKTSGFKQLELRFKKFIQELKDYNFKVRYVHGSSLQQANSLKIFNPTNPIPEVIIALSNYKQLGKLEQHITLVKESNSKKIAPYALFMDEYDELIKSRCDIEDMEELTEKQKKELEKGKKKIEKHSNFIRDNSLINCGVTATLLAVMLTENKLKLGDIFILKPQENYVGFGSNRIKLIDISKHLTTIKNKISIHINKLEHLIDDVDKSLDIDENKNYAILLINISDLSDVHNQTYDIFKNHFTDWSCIILNSKGEDGDIRCSLPDQVYSDIGYKTGTILLDGDKKTYTIDRITEIVPENHQLAINKTKEERAFFRYTITFSKCSISDVITKLMEYTNKVAVVSGKMACRGLSFVDNNYKKHITDMIYVPSGSSSYTRNLQDMRIFGNFNEDCIPINLYTSDETYNKDIKDYLSNQKDIIETGDIDKSCKENLSCYKFNSENVPRKKLDRPGLTKGITFNSDIKWGIPTNIDDITKVYDTLAEKYNDYNILKYSIHRREPLPEGELFPLKPKEYASGLFKGDFKGILDEMFKNFKIKETKYKQWHIYKNYRNAWPLHNPLNIEFINKNKQGEMVKRDVPHVCYMGEENGNYIDIIVRNIKMNSTELKKLKGTKTVIIFYARGCYNYIKCDEHCYIINDNLQILNKL
jgi:hypothetical protein